MVCSQILNFETAKFLNKNNSKNVCFYNLQLEWPRRAKQ